VLSLMIRTSTPTRPHPLVVAPAVHGGIDEAELQAFGLERTGVIDFSANQSPLAVSPRTRAAVASAVLEAYPDRDARDFASAVALRHGVDPAQVVVGNGSTELIRLLAQIILREGDVALSLAPSFGEYEAASVIARASFIEHRLLLEKDTFVYREDMFVRALEQFLPKLCWLCSPNNPTGTTIPSQAIERLVIRFPGTVFVLDEAYCDLLQNPQWTAATLARRNLVVLRSMTKAWGLAGLRLGYALAHDSMAAALRAAKPPWSVNACAQAAGEVVLEDSAAYYETVRLLRSGRDDLGSGLRAKGWTVLPSEAGFFLVRVGDAALVRRRLLEQGCLVRDCSSFGLSQYIRISPRLPAQNQILLAAFARLEELRPDEEPR
jgi:histidinol-phosphate aminotransferase